MQLIRRTALAAALLVIASSALHAQSTAAPARLRSDTALASLVAAEKAFSAHSRTAGAQAAFLRFMAPEALIYRPRVVRAHAYLQARPMPRELLLLWDPVYADVSRGGDLGYTTGPWISSRRDAPASDPTFGEYVTLWRRQRDGSWQAELDAGIAHGADAVGPQGVTAAPAAAWRGSAAAVAAAERSMLEADSLLNHAARRDGAGAAFLRRAGPDMRLLRMGRFPLAADSAHNYLRAASTYTWRAAGSGIAATGDLGYVYGVYAIPVNGPGRESGDYLRIWRRAASGEWQVVLDLTSPEMRQ